MDMNMDGKTVIVAGLGVSGQSMMEVLGSRAGRVLGEMRRSRTPTCIPSTKSIGTIPTW